MTTSKPALTPLADRQRDLLLALIAFVVALVVWQVQGLAFVTYPLRLFVTMIHELGHGLAAILTGGSFVRFEVTRRGAGLAYTSGGVYFIIIQAGYLGTALFGAVLLYLANRTRRPGTVAAALGGLIGALTLLYSDMTLARLGLLETALVAILIIAALYLVLTRERDNEQYAGVGLACLGGLLLMKWAGGGHNWLTVIVGVSSGLLLVILGLRASRDVIVVTLTFLAFLTGLQAITDSWVLLRILSLPDSMMPFNDAVAMANRFGGSATWWAIWWIVLDVLIFGAAVYLTFVRPLRR